MAHGIKKIVSLSIKECCELLNVKREDLPDVLSNINNPSELESLVICRLNYLLDADKSIFMSCSTIEEYENYLVVWSDGLYCDLAAQKITELKTVAEELSFYKSNKGSISGCEAYLNKYPNGRFAAELKLVLGIKKKNRKKRKVISLIIAFTVITFLCLTNYYPVSYLDVTENISFTKKGGNKTISISTDANDKNLYVDVSSKWIKVDRNDGILSISVDPNKGKERTATIIIEAYSSFFGIPVGYIQEIVKIKQKSGLASYLKTNVSEVSFDKYGKSSANCIKAETDGCELDVSTTASWFTITKNIKLDGENTIVSVVLSADVNDEGSQTGEVIFSCNDYVKRVKVSQESGLATFFRVEKLKLTMKEEGSGEGMCYPIDIYTDGTFWSVKSAPSWLTAYADLSDKRLEIKVERNTGKIKTGIITLISNNGDLRDISVTQQGDPTDFEASRSSVKFSTSSDYEYITIYNDSHKSLSVTEYESWMSTSVIDKNKVKISCSRNYDDPPRSGTVYVTCGHEKLSIRVTQNGWISCGKCGGDGKTECSNLYVNPWNTEFGSYAYGWVNGNHVLRRVYTSWTGWLGAPELKTQVNTCEICDGKGYVKCSTCDGTGKIEESY